MKQNLSRHESDIDNFINACDFDAVNALHQLACSKRTRKAKKETTRKSKQNTAQYHYSDFLVVCLHRFGGAGYRAKNKAIKKGVDFYV